MRDDNKIDVFSKGTDPFGVMEYGINITRETKNEPLVSYIGSWKGEFGTEDVLKLKGSYRKW